MSCSASNTAEGGRRVGGDRLHSFRVASAEAAEVLSHVRIAHGWSWASDGKLDGVRTVEDRLQAILWRLVHRRR